MHATRRLTMAALLISTAGLLQGCFPLAAVGVGATALALDDRRSTGLYIEDENIEWRARAKLVEKFKDAHVNATSYNLTVLLTGEVPSEEVKKNIGDEIRAVPNVRGVINELAISGNSSLATRSSDTIVTTNVKARMINNGRVSPNHVKVVTESSVVYLLGIVTRQESDAAADIARTTSGVARVVKVFEYIDKAPK
jgi:osmotically-inducible protein OsmY